MTHQSIACSADHFVSGFVGRQSDTDHGTHLDSSGKNNTKHLLVLYPFNLSFPIFDVFIFTGFNDGNKD